MGWIEADVDRLKVRESESETKGGREEVRRRMWMVINHTCSLNNE